MFSAWGKDNRVILRGAFQADFGLLCGARDRPHIDVDCAAFTDETRDVWAEAYGTLSQAMKDAACVSA